MERTDYSIGIQYGGGGGEQGGGGGGFCEGQQHQPLESTETERENQETISKSVPDSSTLQASFERFFVALGENLHGVQLKAHICHGGADPYMAQTSFEHADGGNIGKQLSLLRTLISLSTVQSMRSSAQTSNIRGLSCARSQRC